MLIGDNERDFKLDEEFILPKDPTDIRLHPRFDIDSVVGSNDEMPDGESQGNGMDVYMPLIWVEMMNFDKEKARKITRAEAGYEHWSKSGQEWIHLVSGSDSE